MNIRKIIFFIVIFISLQFNNLFASCDEVEHKSRDLSNIIEGKSLRVGVAYDNVSFYMNKGKQDGLYVALLKEFKKYLIKNYPESEHLKIDFVPIRHDKMKNFISECQGDIVVGVSPTNDFKKHADFSIPEKLWIKEIAVTSKNYLPITKLEDFSGKYFHVRKSSSYYDSLKNVNLYLTTLGYEKVHIVLADEYLTDADLVDMVDKGEISATIINDDKYVVWSRIFTNANFYRDIPIKVNGTMVWAIRHNTPSLYKFVNNFLREFRDGTEKGTPIFDRYIRTSSNFKNAYNQKNNQTFGINKEKFTQYAEIFKNYGEKFNIHWILLMAQSYQESTLNPNALSKRGAVGIMQVLPSTAREKYINVNSVEDIDNNVHAGTKYMRYMLDNYFTDVPQKQRHLFALAAYNGGPNRITRYRKEAKELGYDPNIWYNNVEKIAIMHGATETVNYVRNIDSLYVSYQHSYNLDQEKSSRPKM